MLGVHCCNSDYTLKGIVINHSFTLYNMIILSFRLPLCNICAPTNSNKFNSAAWKKCICTFVLILDYYSKIYFFPINVLPLTVFKMIKTVIPTTPDSNSVRFHTQMIYTTNIILHPRVTQ